MCPLRNVSCRGKAETGRYLKATEIFGADAVERIDTSSRSTLLCLFASKDHSLVTPHSADCAKCITNLQRIFFFENDDSSMLCSSSVIYIYVENIVEVDNNARGVP